MPNSLSCPSKFLVYLATLLPTLEPGRVPKCEYSTVNDVTEAEMATLPYNLGCEPIAVSLC